MATKHPTKKPPTKASPKPLSPDSEIRSILERCRDRMVALSCQIDGLDTFCSATDEGRRELADFSTALSYILAPMAREAEDIWKQLDTVLILKQGKGGFE